MQNAAAFATCSWASELLRALDKVSSSKNTNEATWFNEGAQVHSALVDELLNAWSVKQQYETRRLSSEYAIRMQVFSKGLIQIYQGGGITRSTYSASPIPILDSWASRSFRAPNEAHPLGSGRVDDSFPSVESNQVS